MDNEELRNLTIGALLHDVGKLVIRSQKVSEGKDHSTVGREWLEQFTEYGLPHEVIHYAAFHHGKYFSEINLSNKLLFVYQADNISAQEREDRPGVYDQRETPLLSIFSRISLNQPDAAKENSFRFHELSEMADDVPYPTQIENIVMGTERYSDLLSRFHDSFKEWVEKGCYLSRLFVLLEKYWSHIPSETMRTKGVLDTYPDISLFDHARTTAAIAGCLYNYFTTEPADRFLSSNLKDEIRDYDKKYFTILGGDFSGVQDFIYTTSSRGALKTLRAKSFFLELLTEHLVTQICSRFNLSIANVIYSGGGRFYLLLPDLSSLEDSIKEISDTINTWLKEKFQFRLYLALEIVAATGGNLKSKEIRNIWANLGAKLGAKKTKKFEGQLKEIIEPSQPTDPLQHCSVCYRDDVELKQDSRLEWVCSYCLNLFRAGDRITRCNYVVGRTVSDAGSQKGDELILPNLDGSYTIYSFEERESSADRDITFLVNSLNPSDYFRPDMHKFLLGNHVRKVFELPLGGQKKEKEENEGEYKPESTASFAGLSASSRGDMKLGALRMDVDNLGTIFYKGLKNPTFSALATLSRELTLFFKFYINQICSGDLNIPGESATDLSEKDPAQNGGRNVSIIYSGGDDLFAVGAWDETAELAFDINKAFREYTCHNPHITISGGFTLNEHDFPIRLIAELTGDAENLAKDNGKNRLTLFYNSQFKSKRAEAKNQMVQIHTWDDISEEVLDKVKIFKSIGSMNKGENRFKSKYPHTLIYKLFSIYDIWEREGVIYLPQLAYTFSRLKDELKKEKYEQETQNLQGWLMNSSEFRLLRNALIWIEMLSRKQ
jgi:CRISPR-associated protein Csm1